jgi:hypothetical protein
VAASSEWTVGRWPLLDEAGHFRESRAAEIVPFAALPIVPSCVDADVWTTDRDFAGAGVATWSTPNLMRAFAEATRQA